jgi:hypothetical protein
MDNAELPLGLELNGLNSLGKAFETVATTIRISLRPRFLRSVRTWSQNFAPSASASPIQSPSRLVTLAVDAQHPIDRALADPTGDFDIDVESIEINEGIQLV